MPEIKANIDILFLLVPDLSPIYLSRSARGDICASQIYPRLAIPFTVDFERIGKVKLNRLSAAFTGDSKPVLVAVVFTNLSATITGHSMEWSRQRQR